MYTGYGPGALTHSGAGGQRKRLNVDLRGVLHAYVLVQEQEGGGNRWINRTQRECWQIVSNHHKYMKI